MDQGRHQANAESHYPPGSVADLTGRARSLTPAKSSECIKRVCSICQQFMGGNPDSDRVSHGMHPACAAKDWPSPYGVRVVRMSLEPEWQTDAGPVRSVCGWDGEILVWTPKPVSAFGMEELAISSANLEVERIAEVTDWTVEIRGGYLFALTPRDWSEVACG